jgi:hypothetical protein
MQHIERWKISAAHNLPILDEIPRTATEVLAILLHPIERRRRVNLWVLCAGLLDAARYMNLSKGDADLHDEYDGNWRERQVWSELSYYIMLNHEQSHLTFRSNYKSETDNFADVLEIKRALYDVIMELPQDARINAIYLLEKATKRHLLAKKSVTA